MKLFGIALLASAALAQTPAFDAASVRPNTLNDRIVTIEPGPGGNFRARGYSLKLLIQYAYSVKGYQVSGGPGWLDVDRYDITARGTATSNSGQLKLMMQSLLAERFALKVQKTRKVMPGLELVLTGKNPKITRSAETLEHTEMLRNADGSRVATGVSMPAFAIILGAYLAKPVADRTGLPGLYDFKILWTESADRVPDPDSTGISLISALRDQLGMKLTPRRVPSDVIVIDHAEKLVPN